MTVERNNIIEVCSTTLLHLPYARAGFIGGSVAFDRQDEYSDIDLVCVAQLSDADAAFREIEGALSTLSPIALKLEMPPSGMWPGLAQRFYRLRDTSEFLMIDFCILTPEQLPTFLEPTRHGTPIVLFDHDGLIKPVPLDHDHAERVSKRVEWLRVSFPMFQNLVRKAALRGDIVEAGAVWLSHTLRPLIELLRARHCPARFDFGFRYTSYDLPSEVAAEIQKLMWPTDGPDLLAKLDRAGAWFEQVLSEIDGNA